MGKYPVTQAQYEKVMGENPSHFRRVEKGLFFKNINYSKSDHPVECVSWGKAEEFCTRVGQLLEEDCRLPTEAQWEYACRAGTIGHYSSPVKAGADTAGNLDAMAWYLSNSKNETHPVGQKQPNAWGLYDMHGNVWEWCNDWYEDYPPERVTDPGGVNSDSYRVLRGGSWLDSASFCRSAFRGFDDPTRTYGSLGFRPLISDVATK